MNEISTQSKIKITQYNYYFREKTIFSKQIVKLYLKRGNQMMFMNHKCNEVQSGEEEQLNALLSMVKRRAEGAGG